MSSLNLVHKQELPKVTMLLQPMNRQLPVGDIALSSMGSPLSAQQLWTPVPFLSKPGNVAASGFPLDPSLVCASPGFRAATDLDGAYRRAPATGRPGAKMQVAPCRREALKKPPHGPLVPGCSGSPRPPDESPMQIWNVGLSAESSMVTTLRRTERHPYHSVPPIPSLPSSQAPPSASLLTTCCRESFGLLLGTAQVSSQANAANHF